MNVIKTIILLNFNHIIKIKMFLFCEDFSTLDLLKDIAGSR